jgi:hypothetical protein
MWGITPPPAMVACGRGRAEARGAQGWKGARRVKRWGACVTLYEARRVRRTAQSAVLTRRHGLLRYSARARQAAAGDRAPAAGTLHGARTNACTPHLDERVQLLITANGQLQVAGGDALDLWCWAGGVARRAQGVWAWRISGQQQHRRQQEQRGVRWARRGAPASWSGLQACPPSGPWRRCPPAPAPQRSGTLQGRRTAAGVSNVMALSWPQQRERSRRPRAPAGAAIACCGPHSPRMAAVYTAAVAPTRPLAVTRACCGGRGRKRAGVRRAQGAGGLARARTACVGAVACPGARLQAASRCRRSAAGPESMPHLEQTVNAPDRELQAGPGGPGRGLLLGIALLVAYQALGALTRQTFGSLSRHGGGCVGGACSVRGR